MKIKTFVLLLAGVLSISLASCGGGSAQSVVSAGNAAASEVNDAAEEEAAEDNYVPKIPAAVLDLSEEEDILLNGELKDGVYVNQYFGYKFTAPEGMTLFRLNDDATETTEIIPLKKAYEDGYGGIMITTELGVPENVSMIISAVADDEVNLSEEELVRAKIKDTNDLSKAFGLEESSEYGTAVLAGEEHPVQISTSDPECIDMYFHIIKGNFMYDVSVSAPDEERIEYLLSFFEKY